MVNIKTDETVQNVFDNYPTPSIRKKIEHLRNRIIEVATELGIEQMEESLKWGEPSYSVKKGSPIRIHWISKKPDQYGMYFSCSSKLVPTFRTVYSDVFEFEGKRAIIFPMNASIPQEELTSCIKTALTYHTVKQLPLLGL